MLDIVDAHTNKLVWRGWAQQRVDDVIDEQAGMRKYVTDGVLRMMTRLPPSSK